MYSTQPWAVEEKGLLIKAKEAKNQQKCFKRNNHVVAFSKPRENNIFH